MKKQSFIFENISDYETSSLAFFAGFHLSLPLTLVNKQNLGGWKLTKEKIFNGFLQHDDYSVIDNNLNLEFINPLGQVLLIKYKKFYEIFQFHKYLKENLIDFDENDISFDDSIWIDPAGVVLVTMNFSWKTNCNNGFNLDLFREILGEHYVELSYIFIEIAKVVFSSLCIVPSEKTLYNNQECIYVNQALINQKNDFKNSHAPYAIEKIYNSEELTNCYENILIDVYFIEYLNSEKEKLVRIDYRDSTIINYRDPDALLAICINYISFINLIWLRKMLNTWALEIQNKDLYFYIKNKRTASDLRILQVYTLQFINQSTPTSVCLIRSYVLIMEECWKEFRMYQLVDNISNQLETLETVITAIESNLDEIRNYRVGLAALFIGLLSIMAVTSELINTIDLNLELDVVNRIRFIFLGFVIGAFLVTTIYFFPLIRKK